MIRFLLDPARSGYLFAVVLVLGYGLVPLLSYAQSGVDPSYLQLFLISVVASVTVAVGFVGNKYPTVRPGKMQLSLEAFVTAIWIPFLIAAILIVATAPAIPLLTALRGGTADLIAFQREEFLKSREGLAGVFVYLNALFTGALLPYSIGLMFLHHFRWRWLLTVLFLLYSISFVEKAFFFRAIVPIIYLLSLGLIKSRFGPKTTIALAASILIFVTAISGAGSDPGTGTSLDFLSADYRPSNPITHILWRAIAVPVFTAADALRVFQTFFNGKPFYGGTSSFFTAVFGMDRIPFERIVFEAQWGQNETGTGSSNSVYTTEAFVNFGWMGVIGFSLFVSLSLKWFARSRDEAFRAIWPLFAWNLYSTGLIGQLLSNGFILFFLIGFLVEIRAHPDRTAKEGQSWQAQF